MRHPVTVKLEANIPHSIFHYLPPGIVIIVIQWKNFFFQYFIQFIQDHIHPVPALSYLHNQLWELQNHYYHD